MGLLSVGGGFISGWILLLLQIIGAKGYPCMVQNASSIFLTIPESFTPGRSFKTLDMIEGDASATGNINLRLKDVNPYFGLDSATKSLILLRELDRETLERKGETVQRLTLVCEYLDANQWRRIDVPIQIVVTDVNDHAPVFQNTPYKFTVSELTPVGSIIFKNINAVDKDSTGNLVVYSIVKGPYSDYVRFEDTLSGNLVLMQPLDYETLKDFNVTVSAKDQGNPPRTATTNVEITVDDGDDQNPEFLQRSYTAELPTDAPIGYELKIRPEPIKAVDKDRGINAAVQYKIVDGANVFDIDKKTGQVFVNGTVSHSALYVLTIRATQVDNPRRDTLTTLRISAEKPNQNRPKFLIKEYSQKVPENIPVGTVILSVRAVDPDLETVLSYSLLSPETVPHFNLSISGDLRVIQKLDYEQTKQYVMFVGVTDGELTDEARVTIDVLNVNDHNPEFIPPEYVFEVPSQARINGGFLGKLNVIDRDGDNVTLTLLNHADAFDIVGRDLIVIDASLLNKTEYHLNVVGEDDGIPPRQSFAQVTVRFPPLALPSKTVADEYFILAIVLGGLAGFLLLVVLCLVCYLGKTATAGKKKPVVEKEKENPGEEKAP